MKTFPQPAKHYAAPGILNALPTKGSRHALIVVSSKHSETRFMLRSLLELWEYDVAEASGPEESVRIAESQRPAAVLIDGFLPMSECLAEVESMKGSDCMTGVPLILLSGFNREMAGSSAAKSGATGFMTKPLDFDALERLLKYFSSGGY